MFEASVDGAMRRGIDGGVMPGGVVAIVRRGELAMHRAWGSSFLYETPDRKAPRAIPARPETIYDLASLTKLFTAMRVMQLVEAGALELDAPVASHLPRFGTAGKAEATVRHLLTHTSGLPAGMPVWEVDGTRHDRLDAVLDSAALAAPGSAYCYSDLGFITLGALLEKLDGRPLDAQIRAHVAGPLRLDATLYLPDQALKGRIAPTEFRPGRPDAPVWGTVHDENAWALGGVAGHAGLFGTALDVARFGQSFLEGGQVGGVRVLATDSVDAMRRVQTDVPDAWRGLGFHLNQQHFMGSLRSPVTYGHTGFTGTSLVVDPRRELVLALLTNRVHPSRENPRINDVRIAVASAAASAFPLRGA